LSYLHLEHNLFIIGIIYIISTYYFFCSLGEDKIEQTKLEQTKLKQTKLGEDKRGNKILIKKI